MPAREARTEFDPGRQLALFDEALSAQEPAPADLSVPLDGSRHSNGRRARLTLGEAARIIREAVKDKSYRKTLLGQLVGRYLRWFRNEYGATDSTIRDYEAILARMSLLLADRDPLEVSTEDLREVIDTWAMRHARTRAKVTSVIRVFWVWAEEEGHVPFSPASKIRRPRAPRKTAPLLPADIDKLMLDCARTTRDCLALLVLLDCGVRRAELGGIRGRDFDIARRQLTVFGKGQKERVIPPARTHRHVAALVPRRAARVRGPPARARRLPPLPREAHTASARLLGRPEEAMRLQHRAPLVVPDARAGWPRRPRVSARA
jgi:integrase